MKRLIYSDLSLAIITLLVFLSLSGCIESTLLQPKASDGVILIGQNAQPKETYAAKQLQAYLYQLTDQVLPIQTATKNTKIRTKAFIVGTQDTNPLIAQYKYDSNCCGDELTAQGYFLKSQTVNANDCIYIAGTDDIGTLYGVYGLLDDHYGFGFYMSGDTVPDKTELYIPTVDETKTPRQYIRGFLPWTNFPQSATIYSWNDYRFILDQMAKMRLNFLHIHNYNFGAKLEDAKDFLKGHNEMFHAWTYNGITPRPFMPTVRTGHLWRCPPWDVNEFLFDATDLFGDYDFGSECTLHNESLTNLQAADKGISLFKKVIEYAHHRGVKIGLGIDIDILPAAYGVPADEPGLVDARMNQITSDYPDLDVVLCFQSEGIHTNEENYEKWHRIFERMYKHLKQNAPNTKIAVSGWGLSKETAEPLPRDVIAAPIAPYSATFEDGTIYGDLEYWSCPWLERDFHSSQYYYPYNIHLSDTIKSYQQRKDNMKGLYCLTWRLTDAVDAKLSYIAKAPWDLEDKYTSSKTVYYEYAVNNYGPDAAKEIISIIDENEPFATDFGECQPTPEFTGSLRPNSNTYTMNIADWQLLRNGKPLTQLYTAADYDKNEGTQNASCTLGGQCVGYISPNHWIMFKNVNFRNGPDTFTATIAAPHTNGGDIDIRLNAPDGPSIGIIEAQTTGDWQTWQKTQGKIKYITGMHDVYLVFLNKKKNELPKADEQLALIDHWIKKVDDPADQIRLSRLRCRIAAAKDHILLNLNIPTIQWNQLPGRFDSWVDNFVYRIDDISSLGNITSIQNRFVQERYLAKENKLREKQAVKAPSHLACKGTPTGAWMTWRNNQPGATGFNVYRNSTRINPAPLPADARSYMDSAASGKYEYTVTAIGPDGKESPFSVPDTVLAGTADTEKPYIVHVSNPTSAWTGQAIDFTVRVVENRHPDYITATLHYRPIGTSSFQSVPLDRKVKSIFTTRQSFPGLKDRTIEYYIEVSDSANTALYPADAPKTTLMITPEEPADTTAPSRPASINLANKTITWAPSPSPDTYWYKIYRGTSPDFTPSPGTYLSYVHKDTLEFTDLAEDFEGNPLAGTCYYAITALDKTGNESTPAGPLPIIYKE